MKKDTSVILSYGLEDFLCQMDKYTDEGWTIATDSYRVCATASSNMYSVLVQRDAVVKEDVLNSIKQLHGHACGCVVCRNG